MADKTYRINEIFYSLQGEGVRAGTPNVFVRFSKCNLACRKEGPMGFDCDTEFESGVDMTGKEILEKATFLSNGCLNVIFTGGEPALQLDDALLAVFSDWYLCIESNGTVDFDTEAIDWVCVSPKTAEHTLKVSEVDEVKYVRREGQGIPMPTVNSIHKIISPAFESNGTILPETLQWCIKLVKENPTWRLSCQQHKLWNVR